MEYQNNHNRNSASTASNGSTSSNTSRPAPGSKNRKPASVQQTNQRQTAQHMSEIRNFITRRLGNLRTLLARKPVEARSELLNHVSEIRMIPQGGDGKTTRQLQSLFASWSSLSEINVSKQKIVLCHYAMRVWPHHAQGAWQLYGHSHGNLPDEPLSLSLDVGVDTHDLRPWRFEEIQNVMKAKIMAREANAQTERRAVLAELADYDQEIGI